MRTFLTIVLVLITALVLLPKRVYSESNVRARVAMALASNKKASCDCGANCTCTKGECGDPNCPSLKASQAIGPQATSPTTAAKAYKVVNGQLAPASEDSNWSPFPKDGYSGPYYQQGSARPWYYRGSNPPAGFTGGTSNTSITVKDRETTQYQKAYERALRENKPFLIWVGQVCLPCEQKWSDCIHARVKEYDGPRGTEPGPCVIIGIPDGDGFRRAGTLQGCPTRADLDRLLNLPKQIAPPVIQQALSFKPMIPIGGFGGGMMMGGGGGGC